MPKPLLNECERPTRAHYEILFMSWAGWVFDFYDLILFTFLLIHLIPGDLVTVLVGLNLGAGAHAAEQMRAALHLDDPLPIQYAKWLWSILHGDLGDSLILGFPVKSEVLSHLPVSFAAANVRRRIHRPLDL